MKPQAVQILVPRALSGISIDIRAATDGSAIRASHSQREDAPTVHRSRETCRAEMGMEERQIIDSHSPGLRRDACSRTVPCRRSSGSRRAAEQQSLCGVQDRARVLPQAP